jgi:hypothetical protein
MVRVPLRAACLSALLAAMSGPVLAQAKPVPAQAPLPPPTKAQIESASFYLSIMMSAMASKDVEGPIKNQLFSCLYENQFGRIADAMDKTIAANAGKVDKSNPTQVLGVMASVCGFKPTAAAQPAPPPAKPGQKSGR